MTSERGWGLSEQHLMPDAVVAFVDGELSRTANERATSHAATCLWCAAEITAQRQARTAVRTADAPSMPAGLLASLRAIPHEVELPATPDGLAVTADGQLVAVQRPDRVPSTGFGSSSPLGASAKLGEGRSVLGKRGSRGAGVVVSGLVLGALALVNTSGAGPAPEGAESPAPAVGGDVEPVGFVGTRVSTPFPAPSFGLLIAR
ncbi:anti-sigma factor family protein [Actinokineospora sp.]|uniref:anti-sigma factor family protein n=1 Tax=Actinokineospora sp. TaxID=1872133 RepID=UPI0040376B3E